MSKNKIAILVKIASLEFEKISNPILSEYDLTSAQYRVLKFLYSQQSERVRVVDIEKQCAITHPTAIGLLDTLEKKGLVSRVVNPNDARSKLISLTDKAKAVRTDVEGVGERIEEMLTSNLSVEEKEQLIKLLWKLLGIEEEERLND